MTNMTPLLKRNEQFASTYQPTPPGPPAARLCIVTCMDHRIDPAAILGVELAESLVVRNSGGRVTQAVIDDIAYVAFLLNQMFAGKGEAPETLFEVAVMHHNQCGTGFLADPNFRAKAAEVSGVSEAALEATAVPDPAVTVKADVERLLTSPLIKANISVSGHVYDVTTGVVTTVVEARHADGKA